MSTDKPIALLEDEKNRRQRLQEWIDERHEGIQASFINAYQLNQSEISSLLRGNRTFGENKARSIEERVGMPRRYLESRHDDSVEITDVVSSHKGEVVIYEFDVRAAMGGGLVLPEQPGVIKRWTVSEEWARLNLPPNTGLKNLCIVTGFGDSMRPMFNPGDPLIIDMGVKTIELDATYFFRVGNEGFIKRIQRIPGVGMVVISENRAFREWTLTPDMDYEIIGRVLKVWRSDDL